MQGGHFFQRDARIASVPLRRALARRFGLLPEVCGQWKAALAVRKNVIATADPQDVMYIRIYIDRHVRVFPNGTKDAYPLVASVVTGTASLTFAKLTVTY